MACFGLVTFWPLPPLLSVPCFRLRMARSTDWLAARPYVLAMGPSGAAGAATHADCADSSVLQSAC
jgi:hypothetical protein